jgi:hypothetical protein
MKPLPRLAGAAVPPEYERRYGVKLLHYWEGLRNGRELPTEDDINPDDELLCDIWPSCFLVQVRDFRKEEFNYTYFGQRLTQACDTELAGAEDTPVASLRAPKLMSVYHQVILRHWPVAHEGSFVNQDGYEVRYRQTLFPFGKEDVDVILGYLEYTLAAPHAQTPLKR